MDHTVWQYDFSAALDAGWGTFILRSDGYFSAVTDYGNYVYRWPYHGYEDFRSFWIVNRWAYPDYVISKLTNPGHYQSTNTRKAAERMCRMFCEKMLPRLAEAIRAEMTHVKGGA